MAQLQDQPPGRPPTQSDPQLQSLQTQLRQTHNELAEARQVQQLRERLESFHSNRAKKNSA